MSTTRTNSSIVHSKQLARRCEKIIIIHDHVENNYGNIRHSTSAIDLSVVMEPQPIVAIRVQDRYTHVNIKVQICYTPFPRFRSYKYISITCELHFIYFIVFYIFQYIVPCIPLSIVEELCFGMAEQETNATQFLHNELSSHSFRNLGSNF